MAKAKVFVTLKEGILDPQGQTVENALKNLGYNNVSNLRIGKYITLDIEGDNTKKELEEMSHKLLANPIIEDYQIEIEG
ncbi:MAG: phosphoribosylformylglycinamidine synthase subunit PurS [Actinobacteria bacterium]|nr:MAG: phosphoribosylformylglycinamidine synthase subunit PurS [Actinomycetota bacterium]